MEKNLDLHGLQGLKGAGHFSATEQLKTRLEDAFKTGPVAAILKCCSLLEVKSVGCKCQCCNKTKNRASHVRQIEVPRYRAGEVGRGFCCQRKK